MKTKIAMDRIYADRYFRCGCCALQVTLSNIDPDFYNAGVCGWNNDTYIVYHNGQLIAICTGYRNLKGEPIPEKVCDKYEYKARKIMENTRGNHEKMQKFLSENLKALLEEITSEGATAMTIKELENNPNYEYHHTAARRGYESRKTEGHVENYEGKYGKGYLIVRPRWDTSNYVYIDYYLEKEEL